MWRQAAGAIVHVNAHDSRKEIAIDELSVSQIPVNAPFISQRDVEIAIRPEVQVARVVVVIAIELRQYPYLRSGIGLICVGA